MLRLVVVQSMKQVAAGLVLGAVAAHAAGSVLAGLLFEVRSTDALTHGAAALTLAVVALLARGLGGRGASSLEPSIALQGE